jgi:hypothetical protein
VTAFEITKFSRSDGPLTKRISLGPDGSVRSDSSRCTMAHGAAQRVAIADMRELASLIGILRSHEAPALGSLQADLPDRVDIATKRILEKLNGSAAPHIIARTGDHFVLRPGRPALALLDFDAKGMPPHMAVKLDELGGFWSGIVSVCPVLAKVARLVRCSTRA